MFTAKPSRAQRDRGILSKNRRILVRASGHVKPIRLENRGF
jgi:hypothetical protein